MTARRCRTFSLLACSVVAGAVAGCSSSPAPATAATAAKTSGTAPITTKILSFVVSNENLKVDKVGINGAQHPDGNVDLAFNTSIQGPFDALFVVSTNEKGEPGYGLHADTLVGNEDMPLELGGVIDTAKMTVGIGVVEGGKFINNENGSLRSAAGVHNLTLYIPNSATLRPGSFVRLYLRVSGTLVPGPIAPY